MMFYDSIVLIKKDSGTNLINRASVMTKSIGSRSFCFFLLILFMISYTSVAPASDRDKDRATNVAVLLDLQGGQGTLGRPAMNGFVLALQEVDPLQKRKFFSLLLDTQSDPVITKKATRRVVSGVSVAAGFTDNDSVLLAGPIFQKKEIPFLSIGATDPSLPDVIGNSIFLTPFGDNTQAAAGAEFARAEFGDSVAILFDNTSQYSRTLPQYFRTRFEELGGIVLLNASYNGGCDISLLGDQVRNLSSQPACIYLAGLPDCIGEVVASLRAVGVDQPIIGGDGLDTPNLLSGGTEPTDGVWYTTHAWVSAETGTPRAQEFISAYQEAYGNPPENAFAALGYDAANLLLDVLGRTEKSRSREISEAFEETEGFEGVTGTISYSEEAHVPLKTVWTIRVTEGELSLAENRIPELVPPPIIPAD
jgi:branched-chain amino acid transport system substrate-binding protein